MKNERETRCTARTQRGRCQVTGGLSLDSEGRVRCPWHDDKRKGRAAAMRRKGGRASAKTRWERAKIPPPPKTLQDATDLSSWLTHAVLQGHVTPKAAQEATRSITQFVKAFQVAGKVRELEQTVQALTKRLKVDA